MKENSLDLSRPLREKMDAHNIVVNERRPGVYRIVSLRRPEVSRTVRGKHRIRKGVENTILHEKKDHEPMKIRIWKAKIRHVRPEISVVISVVAGAPFDGTAWITSVLRPRDEGSMHQSGRAVDLDTTSTDTNEDLHSYLKRSLSAEYDVLLEDRGTSNEHIHVEYDPSE